jgi:hypothetical protein
LCSPIISRTNIATNSDWLVSRRQKLARWQFSPERIKFIFAPSLCLAVSRHYSRQRSSERLLLSATYCKRAIIWHHHRYAIKRAETLNTPEQDKNKHENGPRFRKPNQTRAARRRRELIAGLAADLGRSPNTMEAALIEQAADLIIARDVATAAANTTVMLKISGQITRTLSTLRGKTLKLQPSGRTLADHIAAKRAAKPAARVSDEAA